MDDDAEKLIQIKSVLERYLGPMQPKSPFSKYHHAVDFFAGRVSIQGNIMSLTEHENVLQDLKDLENHIEKAYEIYKRLPMAITNHLELTRYKNVGDEITGGTKSDKRFIAPPEFPMVIRGDEILDHLQRTYSCKNAVHANRNAFEEAAEFVKITPKLTRQAKKVNNQERIVFVYNCRAVWFEFKGEVPPMVPSSGEFLNFITDLLNITEKDWDVISACRAYKRLSTKYEKFTTQLTDSMTQ